MYARRTVNANTNCTVSWMTPYCITRRSSSTPFTPGEPSGQPSVSSEGPVDIYGYASGIMIITSREQDPCHLPQTPGDNNALRVATPGDGAQSGGDAPPILGDELRHRRLGHMIFRSMGCIRRKEINSTDHSGRKNQLTPQIPITSTGTGRH